MSYTFCALKETRSKYQALNDVLQNRENILGTNPAILLIWQVYNIYCNYHEILVNSAMLFDKFIGWSAVVVAVLQPCTAQTLSLILPVWFVYFLITSAILFYLLTVQLQVWMSWHSNYWPLSKENYASVSGRISIITEGLQLELGLRFQMKKAMKFFQEGCSDLRGSGFQYALLQPISVAFLFLAGYLPDPGSKLLPVR